MATARKMIHVFQFEDIQKSTQLLRVILQARKADVSNCVELLTVAPTGDKTQQSVMFYPNENAADKDLVRLARSLEQYYNYQDFRETQRIGFQPEMEEGEPG